MPYISAVSMGLRWGKSSMAVKKSKGLSSIWAVLRPYKGLFSPSTCSFMNDNEDPHSKRSSFESAEARSMRACRIEETLGSAFAK